MTDHSGSALAPAAASVDAAAAEWSTDPSDYQLLGKIGQGAFASVWKATTPKNQNCAVKVLNLDHVDTNLTEIRQEVQAMRLSSHPTILKCHTAFVKDTNLWLVTQLMRKGSSLHCLQAARRAQRRYQASSADPKTPIPSMEPHIFYILHETLLGLQYIHDNGQIHRDIKAGNILLDGNGDVRIADFGVSGWLVNAGTQQEKAKTFVGTPCWMSPELMEQIHGYDYKTDLWSCGITALELAKGYAPYARYPPMKVLILTIQQDPPSLQTYDLQEGDEDSDDINTTDWSKSFSQMVDSCLQKNPAKRPTCLELLQSKHFSAFSKEEYRQARKQACKEEICDLVPDVGEKKEASSSSSNTEASSKMPGNAPVSIVLEQQENRPAGTTWIFADGTSQVMKGTNHNAGTVEDVIDELDQFERQTGGENYARSGSGGGVAPAAATVNAKNTMSDDGKDDLDDFMDEFEKTTGGENFRKPQQ